MPELVYCATVGIMKSKDGCVDARPDTSEFGTKGGIGIAIGVLALGSKGESNQQQNSTNKIKFQIPIALPLQIVENNKT